MAKTILGIVGSYRKNGIIDCLVTEALLSAEALGAVTKKIYLADAHIEFCTNCRHCMQAPGSERGKCIHSDDMEAILKEWEKCDGLIIGSPVNFYNVTAITRKFMERLIGYAYWPWGHPSPTMRSKKKDKAAVLITASAMPAFLGRVFTGAARALKITAETMGAKPVKTIFAGLVAQQEQSFPSAKVIRQAQAAGRLLAGGDGKFSG